jgi:ATP-dependent metalloprotease FtsH
MKKKKSLNQYTKRTGEGKLFTEKAQEIIDQAKKRACSQSNELGIDSLLAAISADKEACMRFAECLTKGDVHVIKMRCPDLGHQSPCTKQLPLADAVRKILIDATELASGTGIPDPTHPGLIDIRHLVCATAMSLEACRMLDVYKPLSKDEAIQILAGWYQERSTSTMIADLITIFRDLRAELMKRVIGQDQAIYAIVESLYNAEVTAHVDKDRRQPSAIIVFAGPPGVGKTYMAELCASFLDRPCRRFDMTNYAFHEAYLELVGFSKFYKGARPGVLTEFVQQNPNAILLFDEIEKADQSTIQLFYQILDMGILEDKFSGESVNFRDTIIIFTTNAGRILYDNPNRSGITSAHSNYHRRTILSALENEINPRTGRNSFPPALVSRLGKGYPILFNHLGINELQRICDMEIEKVEKLLEKQYLKTFSHDPRLSNLIVLQQGGNTDARQLCAETDKFVKNGLLTFFSMYSRENIVRIFNEIDSIRYTPDHADVNNKPEIKAFFEASERPQVLLVANPSIVDLWQKHIPWIQWYTAVTPEEAVDILATESIDLVLLDIWIQHGAEPSDPDKGPLTDSKNMSGTVYGDIDFIPISARALNLGRNILQRIHERFQDVPIFILSFFNDEISEKRLTQTDKTGFGGQYLAYGNIQNGSANKFSEISVDNELFLACVRAGGARGLITTNFSDADHGNWQRRLDDFENRLRDTTLRLYQEKRARLLLKERKALNFDVAIDVDKKSRVMTIKLRNFHFGRAIEASDAGELIDDIERPTQRFEDVIGAKAAKDALHFITLWLKNPKYYHGLGIRPPKGILLTGPPGTGKTMLARALAGESNCAFIEKSATGFVTVWQASGPTNMKNMFDRARRYAPAIVFIDEIDAIGGQRHGFPSGKATEETLNALLVEMDGFRNNAESPIIVVAATNLADRLDEALMRRFDRVIEVDKPDKNSRILYLKQTLRRRKQTNVSEEMIERLATRSVGMTISDIERVVHEASIMAAQRLMTLDDAILGEAFEKVLVGEENEHPDSVTLERCARHEAGHTLIGWIYGRLPLYVTIIGRGTNGGYVVQEHDESKMLYSKPEIQNRVCELLGGRAAEIVFYGPDEGLSTGVSSDLKQATNWTNRMIREYGMSPEFGNVALGPVYDPPQDGPLAARVIELTNGIISLQLENAVHLLEKNKGSLERLSRELIDKNHLSHEDLEKILSTLKVNK